MRWIGNLILLAAVCALLVPAVRLTAQDAPKVEKKTESTKPEAKDGRTTTVEMRFMSVCFIDVLVNGTGPYNFLFDSGASQDVFSTRLAKELDLKSMKSPMAAQGVGSQEMRLAVPDSIKIGGFEHKEPMVAVMDLSQHSGTMGAHMMGIIGQNTIKYMERIKFDFANSKLSITAYKPGEGPKEGMQEMIAKAVIKAATGGGLPGLPGGLPGFPGGDEEKKKPEKKEPGEEDEDEFSLPPESGAVFYFQGTEKVKPAKTRAQGDIGFDYHPLKAKVNLGLFEMEVDMAMWFVRMRINGKMTEMMFDTGASPLIVLRKTYAEMLGVPTAYSYPVKGIGEAWAAEGILESVEIAGLTISAPTCTVMEIAALDSLGDKLGGIVGITLATRFKEMHVDSETKHVRLVAYAEGETNELDPTESEATIKEAAIRTWNGEAAKIGITGETILLDDWKKLGLENGGLKVTELDEGGAAQKAGVKAGDILFAIARQGEENEAGEKADLPMRGLASLIIWSLLQDPGAEVTLMIKRKGEVVEIPVILGKYGWKGAFPEKYKRG